jgi:hypothetical protein
MYTGSQWLTPVILASQEDHGSKPAQALRPYLKKPFTKIGLVKALSSRASTGLKVKALSSSPSTIKKKYMYFYLWILFFALASKRAFHLIFLTLTFLYIQSMI